MIFATGVRFEGVSVDDSGVAAHPVVLASAVALPGQDRSLRRALLPGHAGRRARSRQDRRLRSRRKRACRKEPGGQGRGWRGHDTDQHFTQYLDADIHAVPTVHLDDLIGARFKHYLARNATVDARLTPREIITGTAIPAPDVAADSSRGPAVAGAGDLLKPDLLAPGVNILAAYSPQRTGLDLRVSERQLDVERASSPASARCCARRIRAGRLPRSNPR